MKRDFRQRNTVAFSHSVQVELITNLKKIRTHNVCPVLVYGPSRTQKYLEWRDNEEQTLLWISDDPGCGKSVLARCIVDEDLPRIFPNDSSKRVLYYFFKDTSLEQRSVSRAISTILHQLFVSHPRLIRHALPKYKEMGAAAVHSISRTMVHLYSCCYGSNSWKDYLCT